LKENILSPLLQAEQEYQTAVKAAVDKAEHYAHDREQEQITFYEEGKKDWRRFEETESEKLKQTMAADGDIMEEQAIRLRKEMKLRQLEKADEISERLMEEVLSTLWQ